MRHITLFVAGMTSRLGIREVTARLRDVPGVETVMANPRDSRVRLSGRMEVADVLAAFRGTSYGAAVEPERGADSGETAVGQGAS